MRKLILVLLSVVPGVSSWGAFDLACAAAAVEQGHGRAALASLEVLVAENPGCGEARFWYGRALMAAGRFTEAEAAFRHACELRPGHADSHAWLGNALGSQAAGAGFIRAAALASRMRDAWDRALALDPGNLAARTGYLHFYLVAPAVAGGSVRRAREQVAVIRESDPYLAGFLEAHILRHEGRVLEAEATLRGLLETAPLRPEAWRALGELLLESGRFAEALAVYRDWARQPGVGTLPGFFIGQAAASSGLALAEGEAGLREFLASPDLSDNAPSIASAQARLGEVLLQLGRHVEARQAFEAALALDPSDRSAKDGLRTLRRPS
jgi:tetratricopeptide (TPR) repeat protein